MSHHYQALGGVVPDQRAEPGAAGGAAGRTGPPRDRPSGAVGQPELGAVPRRRGHGGAIATARSGCSGWPPPRTRPTRPAGSTARTSGWPWPAPDLVGSVRIDKVRPYFDRPGFRLPFAEGTVDAVRRGDRRRARHRRPGDRLHHPFDPADDGRHLRLRRTRRPPARRRLRHPAPGGRPCRDRPSVGAELGSAPSWQLAYQSRSGPPSMPWLDPDINDVIDDLAAAGRRGRRRGADRVRLRPRRGGLGSGQRGRRDRRQARPVLRPGPDPRRRPAVRRRTGRPGRRNASALGPAVADVLPGAARRPDFCAARCCVNSRATRPTTAAVDSAADWAELDVDPARAGRRPAIRGDVRSG